MISNAAKKAQDYADAAKRPKPTQTSWWYCGDTVAVKCIYTDAEVIINAIVGDFCESFTRNCGICEHVLAV